MRALVASPFEGSPVEDWSAGIVAAASAGLGACGLWLANRMLGKAAFQTAINSGFKELLDQLQEERRVLMAELSSERIANSTERTQMRGEIANLRQVVESLKNVLRDNGIPVPENLFQGRPSDAIIHLNGTTPSPDDKKD